MKKFLADVVLLSSTLIFLVSVGIYITFQAKQVNNNASREVYVDEEGSPKYSLGSCKSDTDCKPSGCSSQVCTNKKDLITTCELRSDFPDKKIYSCGCVEGSCAWYKK